MKKILVCLLALILALSSVACFAEEYDPSDKYLGIVCYPSSNTTIAVWMTGFLQTAEELGYKPLYIGGDTTDAAAVEQMIDSVIAQYDNLAGVALCINSETRWNMAKKFVDAEIPVVGAWVPVLDEDIETYGVNKDYIVGSFGIDAYKYGYEAGQAVGEAAGGKGTVAVTQSTFNDGENNAAAGFMAAIAENYPDMKVLDPQVESTDVTQGVGVVTSLLQANIGDLVGAFGTTGTSAQTWSQAAEDLGWEGYVIGMDATSANLDILEQGGVYGLVAQPIYDLWADAARHLDAYLRGENPQYENFSDAPVIFADSVAEYREILGGVDTYVAQFK
ncbi:MAG: substrate-binding domain-containing protein [Clostridia bacterium]|nr:substrate-binding domain-containing protein [Clostridia bacterium]